MPNKVPNLRHDPTNFMRGLNSGSYIDTTDQQQNGTTPVEHFTFSKFQLSPNHATGFDFYYAGGFIGSHSKKTSSSPFFGVEVFTIMTR